jgi:hypothetical protein
MPFGFGTAPGALGDQGIPPASTPSPQSQQDDINAIRRKYYGPSTSSADVLEDTVPFNLTAGSTLKVFDDPNTIVNSIIVTCESGSVKVWLRDNTGRPDTTSHIVVPSGGPSPQYILAHLAGRVISIGNSSTATANAVGCVIVQRI